MGFFLEKKTQCTNQNVLFEKKKEEEEKHLKMIREERKKSAAFISFGLTVEKNQIGFFNANKIDKQTTNSTQQQ